MRVVLYDFAPVADTLMGELVQMQDMAVVYEDLIDLILVNRDYADDGYEDYLIDVLCDERDLTIHDRQLVRSAYYRLVPYINQIFPDHQGYWLCCGFVYKLGYFIQSASYDIPILHGYRNMIRGTIQSSRGYYDSGLKQQRF